jgi:hypothetical protein
MPDKDITKQVKPESTAFLVVLGIAGLFLTAIGALLGEGHVLFMNFFAALGAAIIGAATSLYLARVFEPAPMNEIYRLLSIPHNSQLLTEDDKVRPHRQIYHGYLLSRVPGKPQWKYRIFDFSKERRPGYLHAKVDVWVPTDKPGKEDLQVYWYNGYLCAPYHLLLVGRLDPELGSEPDVVQVFPFALAAQLKVMAGLAFLETSDNTRIVTPTILSKVRQTSETDTGPVADINEQAKLLKLWEQHFAGNKIMIPPTP